MNIPTGNNPPPPEKPEHWFERIWTYREETLYRQWFVDIGKQIHTIPAGLFKHLGVKEIDPRWLTHGVFACPPTPARNHYAYITSALSNPWGETPETIDPAGPSGLGMEFLLLTRDAAPWAIGVLHWLMAMQILVAVGELKGSLVEHLDWIPLGTSINPENPNSPIRNLLLVAPDDYPKQFALESGQVHLMLGVGITDAEREFARTQGGQSLALLLQQRNLIPFTDAARESAL